MIIRATLQDIGGEESLQEETREICSIPLGEYGRNSMPLFTTCPSAYYSIPLTRSLASMSLVPPNPDADAAKPQAGTDLCTPEHCFHAFDALYCALTAATPIAPRFADDK